jgi:hypothetical protein
MNPDDGWDWRIFEAAAPGKRFGEIKSLLLRIKQAC